MEGLLSVRSGLCAVCATRSVWGSARDAFERRSIGLRVELLSGGLLVALWAGGLWVVAATRSSGRVARVRGARLRGMVLKTR